VTSPSAPAEPTPPDAFAVVERAADAIARGDLVELNADLQPRAVAELARIAGEADADPGPPITSVAIVAIEGGSEREQLFDIHFGAGDRLTVLRVAALRGATQWRIGRILGVIHEDAEA